MFLLLILKMHCYFVLAFISIREWLSDFCLALNEQFSAYVMARTSKIRQDEGDVRFVLDQHAELDLDSASSLKHAASRHITPLGHIIMIFSQSVFVFIP